MSTTNVPQMNIWFFNCCMVLLALWRASLVFFNSSSSSLTRLIFSAISKDDISQSAIFWCSSIFLCCCFNLVENLFSRLSFLESSMWLWTPMQIYKRYKGYYFYGRGLYYFFKIGNFVCIYQTMVNFLQLFLWLFKVRNSFSWRRRMLRRVIKWIFIQRITIKQSWDSIINLHY